jgi:hypothetical protein
MKKNLIMALQIQNNKYSNIFLFLLFESAQFSSIKILLCKNPLVGDFSAHEPCGFFKAPKKSQTGNKTDNNIQIFFYSYYLNLLNFRASKFYFAKIP